MERQETTGIGWFIAGIGLGALVGVLFAPKSGRETREGLISGARDKKDYVAMRSKQAREQINSVVDRSKDQINDYAERGKGVVEKSRERWSGMVDRVGANQPDATRGSRSDEDEAYRAGAETHF